MGAQIGNTRLAGQASAQQRAAASDGIQMRRAALRNAEQGGGVNPETTNEAALSRNEMGRGLSRIGAQMGDKGSPAYEQAMQRIRGMGPMNNPNPRY
jgi:hypothetical protein